MTSNQPPIIIKKIKKQAAGHHGGSWKVAYADFVTAMMAFFLLMWLLNMTADEQRARLAYYFKHFSLFQESGSSIMSEGSETFTKIGENKQESFKEEIGATSKEADAVGSLEEISVAIENEIREKLGDIQDQVLIDTVDDGVRIQMVDKEGSLMFKRGNKELTPDAETVLKVIGGTINSLTNKITIEGHTDALPYLGEGYSNWELSTERASSARIELEASGLDPDRIISVAGYAATDPLIKDDPSDPRNRRISIILKIPKKEKTGRPVISIDEAIGK